MGKTSINRSTPNLESQPKENHPNLQVCTNRRCRCYSITTSSFLAGCGSRGLREFPGCLYVDAGVFNSPLFPYRDGQIVGSIFNVFLYSSILCDVARSSEVSELNFLWQQICFYLRVQGLQSCGHQTIQSHRSASHLSFWKIRLQDVWFFHGWFFPGWLFQWVIRLWLFLRLRQSKEVAMVLGLRWQQQILRVFGLQCATLPLSCRGMPEYGYHHWSARHWTRHENYKDCNRCETLGNSNQRGPESFGGTRMDARIGESLLTLWALHDSF